MSDAITAGARTGHSSACAACLAVLDEVAMVSANIGNIRARNPVPGPAVIPAPVQAGAMR